MNLIAADVPGHQPRSGCVLQPNVAALRGYVGGNPTITLPRSGCVPDCANQGHKHRGFASWPYSSIYVGMKSVFSYSDVAQTRRKGHNRFAVEVMVRRFPQRSREARQRWAGGRNRFAVECSNLTPTESVTSHFERRRNHSTFLFL
jgi:hypothetical protein